MFSGTPKKEGKDKKQEDMGEPKGVPHEVKQGADGTQNNKERVPKLAISKSVKSCEILMKSLCNSHEILEILRFNKRKSLGISYLILS